MYYFIYLQVLLCAVVVADDDKQKSKKDPVNMKVNKLRSELSGYEFKMAITQPVKETLSAGKSLLSLGQRFSGWLRSLVKSQ